MRVPTKKKKKYQQQANKKTQCSREIEVSKPVSPHARIKTVARSFSSSTATVALWCLITGKSLSSGKPCMASDGQVQTMGTNYLDSSRPTPLAHQVLHQLLCPHFPCMRSGLHYPLLNHYSNCLPRLPPFSLNFPHQFFFFLKCRSDRVCPSSKSFSSTFQAIELNLSSMQIHILASTYLSRAKEIGKMPPGDK